MNFFEDVRFGARMLVKDPKFTAVVVLALGLGMGANTTVFTLVNAVLFRGLPFENPERVMYLSCQRLTQKGSRMGDSYPDFQDWRAQSKSFQDLAGFAHSTMNLSEQSNVPERYFGASVSANTFSLIGQKPMLGRDFLPGEDQLGAAPVVILGYDIWKNRYGKDPEIVGRTVRVNDVPATVIGVMPEGMKFPLNQQIWMPLVPKGEWEKRDSHGLNVFGRLKDGVTLAVAQAEMNHIAKTLEKEYAKTNEGVTVVVKPYNDAYNGDQIRVVFLTLLGAVGFVLVIACANVANMLLSRSLSRAKEVSIRTALGASRWRVVRQLLVESVMLGLLGGVLGWLLSLWGIRMFDLAVANVDKPYWIKFTIDYAVFGYIAAISVATGILFGLAPALHMSKVDINETLKEGGRGTAGSSRAKYLSAVLVVGELALSLVLLAGAGLMVRTFLKLYGMDPGFNANNILTMQFNLGEAKYPKPEARVRFQEQLLPRLASVPGVESVALASALPLIGASDWKFEVEGEPPVESKKRAAVSGLLVTSNYFRVLGVALQRGRMFNEMDGSPGKAAVIVNQQFAAKHWPKDEPIGKRLRLIRDSSEQPWLTVVGVCPGIRFNLSQTAAEAAIYIPYRQDAELEQFVIARTKIPPTALTAAFRKEVQVVDSDLPLYNVRTLPEAFAEARWPFRVFGSLFAIFAIVALLLATVGIYAVISYAVSQRTQEIGIRMALGASSTSILRLVLTVGLKQLAIGLAVGLGMAFGVTRVLAALLGGITPTDPVTFGSISLLLAAVGILACWVPARRATKVDPLIALRYE